MRKANIQSTMEMDVNIGQDSARAETNTELLRTDCPPESSSVNHASEEMMLQPTSLNIEKDLKIRSPQIALGLTQYIDTV